MKYKCKVPPLIYCNVVVQKLQYFLYTAVKNHHWQYEQRDGANNKQDANNLDLNHQTKEIVIDFRRHKARVTPLSIKGVRVQGGSTQEFLVVMIFEDLSWSANTSALAQKAQVRLHVLRVLQMIKTFLLSDHSGMESVLVYCISVWYTSCSAAKKKAKLRVIKMTEKNTECLSGRQGAATWAQALGLFGKAPNLDFYLKKKCLVSGTSVLFPC